VRGERAQVAGAGLAIHVEAQVRELDGELSGEPALTDLGEDADIVVAHRRGRGGVRHLLAQLGEHRPDAAPRELGGRSQRGVHVFARQEAPHRPPKERAAAQLVGEPGAAGGPEQEATGNGHGD